MNPNSWSTFHDGSINKIEGDIPGNICLHIEILYLREMFPGVGEGFIVNLKNCSTIEYREYEGQPTRNLAVIESKEPELLSVRFTSPVLIDCVMGTLRLEYDSASVTLDTGEPISDEELNSASKKYWEDWKQKWQQHHS